jgi:hypothetical protein
MGVLLLNGVIFVLLGLGFLFDPMGMAATISLEPTSAAGMAELRAVYGGLELGLGGFFLLALRWERLQESALWLLLIAYGGISVGRMGGVLLDQPSDSMTYQLLAIEIVGAALAGAALWRRRS